MKMQKLPTPCYVIYEGQLRKNLEVLKALRDENGCSILLSQKAFTCFYDYPMIIE